MDLSASPDFDAFYCYLIVFLLGLITAIMQINKRLLNYPGKWVTWHTWTLLGAYTLLPVALFWFLDRVNAIHDTSLFAAILIGAGYQQVLSGNLASIRAGEVSKIWQPFTAWSDYIADRIRDRIDYSILSVLMKNFVPLYLATQRNKRTLGSWPRPAQGPCGAGENN